MANYYRRGTSMVHWETTMADTTTPSTTNDVDNDITGDIADMSGWEFNNNPIATPSLASTFTTTITGPDDAGSPSMDLYDNDANTTTKDLLAKGNAGYVILSPNVAGSAPVATERADVFTVTVASNNSNWTLAAEAATYTVTFVVTAVPDLEVAWA